MFCMNALDFYTGNCKVRVYEVIKIHEYKGGVDYFHAMDTTTKETVKFKCVIITKNIKLLETKHTSHLWSIIFFHVPY